MRAQTSPDGGTFAGVVVDTAGHLLRDVEVLIPDIGVTTRSDSAGAFTLLGVKPGRYEVWFRKVGFIVVQFAWESRVSARLEVRVKMRPLPNTLDPVRVYASEERTMKARSMVSGKVTDANGVPLDGAQVQLTGAQRSTLTADDGSFAFRHVAPGPLVLRARLLGFSPATTRFTLEDDDVREFLLVLKPLAQTLDEVRITAESGFDIPSQVALKDFDERLRWRHVAGSSRFWGPERLSSIGGGTVMDIRDYPSAPLCNFPGNRNYPCEACVLVDGVRGYFRPINTFVVNDLDMIEYYPPAAGTRGETEWTGTVAERLSHVNAKCRGELGTHPAYFVIWTKGSR